MHDRLIESSEPTVVLGDGLDPRLFDEHTPVDEPDAAMPGDPAAPPGSGSDDTGPEHEHEGRFARRAKLIALLLVTGLLATSLIVAWSLTEDTSERTSHRHGEHRHEITGAAALGGFTLPGSGRRPASSDRHTDSPSIQQAGTDGSTTAVASGSSQTSTDSRSSDPPASGTTKTRVSHITPAAPARTEDTAPATPRSTGNAALVRRFYELVRTAPKEALGRLTPTLLNGQHETLLSAWRSMTDVLVEKIHRRADGTLRVVVRMRPADGTPLRITQLLEFNDRKNPLINRATVLSVRAVG